MAIIPFRHAGDPVLKLVAAEVTTFDLVLRQIATDMLDTSAKGAPGLKALGLSAPQIGYSQCVIVVGRDVYVNPIITDRDGVTVTTESCFSEPGKSFRIRRSKRVKVRYQDLDGLHKTIKAQALTAAIFQHEIDHLDGILMSERAAMEWA